MYGGWMFHIDILFCLHCAEIGYFLCSPYISLKINTILTNLLPFHYEYHPGELWLVSPLQPDSKFATDGSALHLE